MMDVDDALGKDPRELWRQNLHVAGQHNEFDFVLAQQFDLPALGLRLRLGIDRDLLETHAIEISVPGSVIMIADDQRNLAGKFARTLAVEQVYQAVVLLGNEDGYARTIR
jgi:hypothetical protein